MIKFHVQKIFNLHNCKHHNKRMQPLNKVHTPRKLTTKDNNLCRKKHPKNNQFMMLLFPHTIQTQSMPHIMVYIKHNVCPRQRFFSRSTTVHPFINAPNKNIFIHCTHTQHRMVNVDK